MWFVWLLFSVGMLGYGIVIISMLAAYRVVYYFYEEDRNFYYHDKRVDNSGVYAWLFFGIVSSILVFGVLGGVLEGGFGAVAFGGLVCGPGITTGLFFALKKIIEKTCFKKALRAYWLTQNDSNLSPSKRKKPIYKYRNEKKAKREEKMRKEYEEWQRQQEEEEEYQEEEEEEEYQQKYQEEHQEEEHQEKYQEKHQDTSNEYFLKAISVFGLKLDYTEAELKKKYKEIMKTYHPDKYQNERPEIKKLVEEKAKETNELYEYLLNRLNAGN